MAKIAVYLKKEDGRYEAKIPQYDIVANGTSRLEAMINLRKGIKKFLVECSKCGYTPTDFQSYYKLVIIS